MAQERVQEFRQTVEDVIQKQVDESGNVSWRGMDTTARTSGLTFGSYAKSDSRPHTFSVPALGGGFPERVWGVHFEGWQRVEGVQRLGLLAVVSTVDRPDRLLRHWCFGKELGLSIDTTREIDDPETIDGINAYIRSPHLTSRAVIGEIAVLSADELTSVQEREAKMNEWQEKLREDLKAIDEAYLEGARAARDIYLR